MRASGGAREATLAYVWEASTLMVAPTTCPKCGGLVVDEALEDRFGCHFWRVWGWRCVNCGMRGLNEFVQKTQRTAKRVLCERSDSR